MKKLITTVFIALLTFMTLVISGVSPVIAASPANDNFSGATVVNTLPFSDTVDTTDATLEPGEPIPSCGYIAKTVWYVFTPANSGSVSASLNAGFSEIILAVYTGSSLSELSEVGCGAWGPVTLTLSVTAGTTYYFQAGSALEMGGSLTFNLSVTPPPIPSFNVSPLDPSIFDTVEFSDTSTDPANLGLETWEWDLGDGTTSQDQNPNHQYAADGDYTVLLTVTTIDGRTASTSQMMPVRTHDVAITKFSVVKAAVTGLTRKVTVDIESKRYPEEVSVELYKSTAAGFILVGCLSKSVPLHNGKKPTSFTFSYTFTSEDTSAGWVTFRAVATIVGYRDAFPTNNEVVAPPTKVQK